MIDHSLTLAKTSGLTDSMPSTTIPKAVIIMSVIDNLAMEAVVAGYMNDPGLWKVRRAGEVHITGVSVT